MTRGHLRRFIIPLSLLGTAVTVVGLAANHSAVKSSKLTTDPSDSAQNGAQASVSADAAQPSVQVDGVNLPLPTSGHSKLNLGNNRNVDVTVSGNTLTVNEEHGSSSSSNNGNASVQVNISTSST